MHKLRKEAAFWSHEGCTNQLALYTNATQDLQYIVSKGRLIPFLITISKKALFTLQQGALRIRRFTIFTVIVFFVLFCFLQWRNLQNFLPNFFHFKRKYQTFLPLLKYLATFFVFFWRRERKQNLVWQMSGRRALSQGHFYDWEQIEGALKLNVKASEATLIRALLRVNDTVISDLDIIKA